MSTTTCMSSTTTAHAAAEAMACQLSYFELLPTLPLTDLAFHMGNVTVLMTETDACINWLQGIR